jgi:hypothetical protein
MARKKIGSNLDFHVEICLNAVSAFRLRPAAWSGRVRILTPARTPTASRLAGVPAGALAESPANYFGPPL